MAAEWYVRALSVNDMSKGRGIVFSGSPGCGKTKTARSLYQFSEANGAELIAAHKTYHWSSLWIDWPNVAEAKNEDVFEEYQYRIQTARFIVLDDVGSETDQFRSGMPAARLRRVLSMFEGKPLRWVVITTNADYGQLVEKYDARAADRLRSFQWCELGEVPSYRPKLIQ